MNQRIKDILIDGLILFAVSTVFVIIADQAFSGLKGKTPKEDPIVNAIVKGDMDSIKELSSAGESVTRMQDAQGRNVLIHVAYANLENAESLAKLDSLRAGMIPLLVQNGAESNHADKDGWTALIWAAWSGLPETTAQLIANGADIQHADTFGITALSIAAKRGNANVAALLVENGADPSHATHDGKTVLAMAKTGMDEYPDKADSYRNIMRLLGE